MSSRARVGVNLLWLVPGVVGGTEEYITRLLAGIAAHPPDDLELVLFASRGCARAYPGLLAAFEAHVAPIDGANKVVRVAAEATWLARAARRARVEVLHHPAGTIPALRATPAVLTVHDLQPIELPRNFAPVKRAYLRWRLPASVAKARLVIAITEHARRSLVEQLGVAPERLAVVPPGYSARSGPVTGDPAGAYGITGPFFLYPAITYPHKNHLVLLRAFAPLVATRPDVLLVLTSGPAQMEEAIAGEIDRLGIGPNVRRLPRVPRDHLDWLLQHAVALAFPSRFEGFGLPVLEAMGHGCPVIASTATALPEVVGEAGLLVDPDDVAGWTAAMARLLDDAGERARLVAAGRVNARRYTWEAATDALLVAYRRALTLDPATPR